MFEWVDSLDLITFDFDGLLVNTEDLHYLAYREMLKGYGFDLPWDFQAYCIEAHISTEVLATAVYSLFPALLEKEPNWEVLRKEKNRIYASLIDQKQIKLMDGVKELLLRLSASDVKACVVTNSTKAQTDQIRFILPELNSIEHWIVRERYARAKPAPDAYLTALELLKDPGDRVVGFEDTMKGANALIAAGIAPILIWPETYPPKAHDPNIPVFSSFFNVVLP